MSRQSVMEFLEAAAGAAMIAGLVAIYFWATPAQSSAEADLLAYECESVENGAGRHLSGGRENGHAESSVAVQRPSGACQKQD